MCAWADDEGAPGELPSEGQRSSIHEDLHILFECDRPLAGSTRHCLDDLDEVIFGRGRERSFERDVVSGVRRLSIAVPDAGMSSSHAKLRRLNDAWVLDHAGSRDETYLSARRFDRTTLIDGSTFELGHTHFLLRSRQLLRTSVRGSPDVATPAAPEAALATLNHECEALFAELAAAARAGIPILLIGEGGSGKDSLARAIHAQTRRRGEFVAVDCALLGRGLAPTGAGDDVLTELALAFRRAAGGTLFLNEIEGLSPAAQLALLPILKSSPRPGGASVLSSVRSNHDLRPEVPRIRADLLAQLAGFTMPVQPLRERREDLGVLVAQILRRSGGADPSQITMDPVMGHALLLYTWPYNISELDICVRTAIALSADGCLRWSPATIVARAPMVRETPGYGLASPRLPDQPVQAPAEPDTEFAQNVRRALKCNLSVPGLQKNGLLNSDMVLLATKGSAAATMTVPALRDIVLSAVETMRKSSPRGDKQSRVLDLTFIKPTPTQQEAADRLAMAFGTYRRYVTSALVDLTTLLWFTELSARMQKHSADAPAGASAREPSLRRLG